ncbi:MAG: L-histidine N(alpha)-methyltransferase [Methanomicrobiales archaeon]|nr:L-histidine N(alpha)-methyltransferase [Methanomicrobiales archaeon]
MASRLSIPPARGEIWNYLASAYRDDLASDILAGMTAEQKHIPSKYFYDRRGSQLFEEICRLPEYYQTRLELSILRGACGAIMESFGEGDLVELGPGADPKISLLIEAAAEPGGRGIRYIPVDVSESALATATESLLRRYPQLQILGIVGDFTRDIGRIPRERKRLITFFGSTIGNFTASAANRILASVAAAMREGDRFLIGLDLVKPIPVLEAAYNDAAGVTAAFNKNVLAVINRELDADFDPGRFEHHAFFNKNLEQIEMHLVASEAMMVRIPALSLPVEFEQGETILTEISRKFTREGSGRFFEAAGLAVERWFSDPKGWFALAEVSL